MSILVHIPLTNIMVLLVYEIRGMQGIGGTVVKLRMRVLGGPHHGDVIDFVEPRRVHIGRDPNSDIVLGAGNASRRHARIHWDGENLLISDLDSKNGVYVNDELIKRQTMLKPDDSIVLGDCEIRIEDRDSKKIGPSQFDPLARTVDED